VAVNRADLGDDRVHRFCDAEGLEIVLELPNDRRIAEAYSRGDLLLDAIDGLERKLSAAWERISSSARRPVVRS
jgi:MinD superfamily P-loop ATPase